MTLWLYVLFRDDSGCKLSWRFKVQGSIIWCTKDPFSQSEWKHASWLIARDFPHFSQLLQLWSCKKLVLRFNTQYPTAYRITTLKVFSISLIFAFGILCTQVWLLSVSRFCRSCCRRQITVVPRCVFRDAPITVAWQTTKQPTMSRVSKACQYLMSRLRDSEIRWFSWKDLTSKLLTWPASKPSQMCGNRSKRRAVSAVSQSKKRCANILIFYLTLLTKRQCW